MSNTSGKGWIGLDLGHRNIVIAQVQRSGALLRVSAACEMPRTFSTSSEPSRIDFHDVTNQELATARLLATGLKGKTVACVLPISVTELSHATLPPGERREQYSMVANELGCSDGRQFDFWPSSFSGNGTAPGLLDVNVIAVDEPRAAAVADVLNDLRWDCRVLDGLPQAVARAVNMVVPSQSARPIGALHLGYDEAVFVLSRRGVPVFTRQLRNCGIHRMIALASEALCLLQDEAVHVLRTLGLPQLESPGVTQDDIQDVLAEIVAEPLEEIAAELRRTLSFLSTQGADAVPDSICAIGEGAAITNLAPHLAHKVDISVWTWNLPDMHQPETTTAIPPALLAIPAALSSLAWKP